MSTYTIKAMKTWRGREGLGTQCQLCRDNKVVAQYTDDANGVEARIEWLDRAAALIPIQRLNWEGMWVTERVTPEEALLWSHIKDMTYEGPLGEPRSPMQIDVFIAGLCDAHETQKRIRARLRHHIWFRRKSKAYTVDEWSTVRMDYTRANMDELRARLGNDLGEVMNAKYGEEK